MTETRCEPPPELRFAVGRHWLRLQDRTDCDQPALWMSGFWTWGGKQRSPEDTAALGFRYLAPVTPPAVVARLVEALEAADQFIRNGIELGYIRMPSPSTPDPAHETPNMVSAALAAYREAVR